MAQKIGGEVMTILELVQEVLVVVAMAPKVPKVPAKQPVAYDPKWLNNTPDLNAKKQRRATRWG